MSNLTPQDVIESFFTEFPALKDKVKFMSYDTREERMDTRDILLEAVEQAVDIELDHKALKKSGQALEKFNKTRPQAQAVAIQIAMANLEILLDNGMPFAYSLKDADPLSKRRMSDKSVVFKGTKDSNMRDLLWGFTLTKFGALAKMVEGQFGDGSKDSFSDRMEARAKQAVTLPAEMQQDNQLRVFFLDHEIGHAISNPKIARSIADTYYMKNFAECVADAYATIRHFERFGRDSKLPEAFKNLRAVAGVVVPDATHWTPHAIQAVIDLNAQGALNGMTPQKALELSLKIAEECAISIEGKYNMEDAFEASVLRDTASDFAVQKTKSVLSGIFSKQAKRKDVSIKDIAEENALERLENIEDTLEWAVDTALKTKSKAVFDAVEAFVDAVPQYWPNVDQGVLSHQAMRLQSAQDRPRAEPEMSFIRKGIYTRMKGRINR